MKKCSKCLEIKEDCDFYKDKGGPNSLRANCIQCYKKKNKELYIKNGHKYREHNAQFYLENKEKIINRCKKYASLNKEKVKIKNQEFYKKQDKVQRSIYNRQYREKNAKQIEANYKAKRSLRLSRRRDRIKNNPLIKLKIRIVNLIFSSLYDGGYSKKTHTYNLLQCSYEDLMKYLGPKPEGNYHLDHICPCSQAQNEEELIKLQHYSNFRWLSAEENLKKSNNWTLEGEELCKILLGRNWFKKDV